MSVSLPSDKLLEILKLAHSLLQRQPVAVHQDMSFLGKTAFCAYGHAQLFQLGCVIQCDVLNVYHSPAHLFVYFTFLFQHSTSFRDCLNCSIVQSLCNFLFLMWVLLHPFIGPFVFSVLGFFIMWSNQVRFYAKGSYYLVRTPGCCTDAAQNSLPHF